MKTRLLFLLAFVCMCCSAAIAQIPVRCTVVSDKDSEPMIGVQIREELKQKDEEFVKIVNQ